MLARTATVVVPAIPVAASVFGWAAGAIGVGVNVPQAWRLWVDRKHAGLSLTSNVLMVLYATAWMLYGFETGRMVQIVTMAAGTAVAFAVFIGHIVLSRPRPAAWVPLWLVGTAFMFAVAATTEGVIGITASAATIGGIVPQVVSLVRQRRAGSYDVAGVSVFRWVLSTLCNLLWLGFGLLAGDPLLVLNAIAIMALGLAIILLTMRSARDEMLLAADLECVPA